MNYKNLTKAIWVIIFFFLLGLIIIAFTSCATTLVQPPDPGSQLVTKLIIQNNWLLTISIFGVGAGFFAFLNGNSKGISIMSACLVVMCLILMIAKFAVWLAIITMIGAVSLVAYTVLVRNRALKEVVTGVQFYKDKLLNKGMTITEQKFTDDLNDQSKQTQKLVKKIKEKL